MISSGIPFQGVPIYGVSLSKIIGGHIRKGMLEITCYGVEVLKGDRQQPNKPGAPGGNMLAVNKALKEDVQ